MKNEELKKILYQIRRYNLIQVFDDENKLKLWLSNLNKTQIANFLSLNINIAEIKFPLFMLTDLNMLNCTDYKERIKALSALKNDEGCWHLIDRLLKINFLQSDRYYQDIEMLSKAHTVRFALWVIGEDDFINSPYHAEDLYLIVSTHYQKSDALATVAGNIDSINSSYHQADMNLIAKSNSDCLQMSGSFPKSSLNNLATNKVSLNDSYHLENMKILATMPIAGEFLYIIMTNSNIIKGENYRKEVEALLNAKSINTARAIYYYIVNPDIKYEEYMEFFSDCKIDYIKDDHTTNRNSIIENKPPNYMQYLATINEIADIFVMQYVSILMNPNLINCEFIDYDLKLLKSISDVSIFMDLYRFITNKTSLKNPFHKLDIELLSKTCDSKIRKLLLKKLTDEYSLKSQNRNFDLEYISSLNIDSMDNKMLDHMRYFLFSPAGIDAKNHKEALKNIYEGIYESSSQASNYLDTLEQLLNDSNGEDSLIETISTTDKKKSRIFSLFKKYGKR
ncbi:MAG: hypothetical protein RR325_03525 [Bacilli bacterium]